jgi:hypothetical protein
LLWSVIGIAILVAGCGGASATASPTAAPTPTIAVSASPMPSASPSALPSGSPNGSAAASPSDSGPGSIGLPHVDAALEDLLPSIIGGISLEKFSMPLSSYVASSAGGDKRLYAPWLVNFGKTPDDVNIAISADLTQTENLVIHAIKVPGVADATLSADFANVARAAGWPVNTKSVAAKTVLEIVDPTAVTAGVLPNGYVYAKNNILFVVITDDPSLLLEALIKLP